MEFHQLPSVNINLVVTGFYAFLIAILAIGSWSIVTLATAGILPIEDASDGLMLLFGFIAVVGIMTYVFNRLD